MVFVSNDARDGVAIMIQKITQNNGNFCTVNLIMRAKIVNQSSDFPVRRTGSYRHKKALYTILMYIYTQIHVVHRGWRCWLLAPPSPHSWRDINTAASTLKLKLSSQTLAVQCVQFHHFQQLSSNRCHWVACDSLESWLITTSRVAC